MRIVFLLIFHFLHYAGSSQELVSGTVYDKNKTSYVADVKVVSSSGNVTYTDTLGKYKLTVTNNDSLMFIYRNKPTRMFAVKEMPDIRQFDISLHVELKSKYDILPDVKVYSRTYQQDSIENREEYADIFDYRRPGVSTSVQGGVAGADLGELINIFRFRRNRRLNAFQERLALQEEQRYVDYRFSRKFVMRVTGLNENETDTFLVWFRPSYEFTRNSNEVEFNQYILDASYLYRQLIKTSPAQKPKGISIP